MLYPIFIELSAKTSNVHVKNILQEWFLGMFLEGMVVHQDHFLYQGTAIPFELSAVSTFIQRHYVSTTISFDTIEDLKPKTFQPYYVRTFLCRKWEKEKKTPEEAMVLLSKLKNGKISNETVKVVDSKIVFVDEEALF